MKRKSKEPTRDEAIEKMLGHEAHRARLEFYIAALKGIPTIEEFEARAARSPGWAADPEVSQPLPAPQPALQAAHGTPAAVTLVAAQADRLPETTVSKFPDLLAEFARLRAAEHGNPSAMRSFFAGLVDPPHSLWIRACRELAQMRDDPPDDKEIARLWSEAAASLRAEQGRWDDASWRGSDLVARARLILDCALQLREADSKNQASSDLRKVAGRFNVPWNMVSDIQAVLLGGDELRAPRGKVRQERRPRALLVDETNGHPMGLAATLWLELIGDGQGELYPSPETALTAMDGEFMTSMQDACDYLRGSGVWRDDCDVRWRLLAHNGQPLTVLRGGSLGAAMAFGAGRMMGELFDPGQLPELAAVLARVRNPDRVCLSGHLDPLSGQLSGLQTNGILEKINAASQDASVRMVIFPQAATAALDPTWGHTRSRQSPDTYIPERQNGSDLTILCRDRFDHALHDLVVETDMPRELAWADELNAFPALTPRAWLGTQVADFERHTDSGVLLIRGEGGTGKTCFAVQELRARIDRGERPVAHLMSPLHPGWHDPKLVFGSLTAQLRRKHSLPAPSLEDWGRDESETPGEVVPSTLELAATLLAVCGKGARETIWIDGLDGNSRRYHSMHLALKHLLEALTRPAGKTPLPSGLHLVVLSRPASGGNDCLAWLTGFCSESNGITIDLDDKNRWEDHLRNDLSRYFQIKAGHLKESLRTSLVNGAMESGSPFLQARGSLHDVVGDFAGNATKTVEQQLDDMLRRMTEAWQQAGGRNREDAGADVLHALGLLAAAREPLSLRLMGLFAGEAIAGALETIVGLQEEIALDQRERNEGDGLLVFQHDYFVSFLLSKERQGARTRQFAEMQKHLRQHLPHEKSRLALRIVWHETLARACTRWTRDPADPAARNYARRYLLSHLRHAEMWDDLVRKVTDMEFIQTMLGANKVAVADLVRLLGKALDGSPKLPPDHADRPLLNRILEIIRTHADVIAEDPFLALQQLRNELEGDHRGAAWFARLEDTLARAGERLQKPALRILRRTQGPSAFRPQLRLLHHNNSVHSLVFAPFRRGGQMTHMLASVGADHQVCFWERTSELRCLPVLRSGPRHAGPGPGHPGLPLTAFPLIGAAFVRGGQMFVCASANGLHVMDLASDDLRSCGFDRERFIHCMARPQSLAAAPDSPSPVVVIGSESGPRFYDIETQANVTDPRISSRSRQKDVLAKQGEYHCGASMSAGGSLVAVGAADGTIYVWAPDWDAYRNGPPFNRTLPCRLLHKLPMPVRRQAEAMAFSPDGRFLAVGGGFELGYVELWDLGERRCVRFPAHRNSTWAITFCEEPLGPGKSGSALLLITGSYDRSSAVWDLDAILELSHLPGCYSERPLPAIQPSEAPYTVCELKGHPEQRARMEHADIVLKAAVSPNGQQLAISTGDYVVSLYDLPRLIGARKPRRQTFHQPQTDTTHAAAIHPSGEWFATASHYGEVRIQSFDQPGEHQEHQVIRVDDGDTRRAVRAVGYSRDGRWLAFGTESAVYVYDTVSKPGRPVRIPCPSTVHAVAFTPGPEDGFPTLVAGDKEGRVMILDYQTGAPPRLFRGRHEGRPRSVRSLASSPRGTWLVSVGDDRRILLHNTRNPDDLPVAIGGAEGHQGRIKSAVFSPDGERILTGGYKSIRIWKRVHDHEWKLEHTLEGHRSEIWTMNVSPCGRFLASGSHDCTARIWKLDANTIDEMFCCLPCGNNVLATWFNQEGTELRVVEAGFLPTGQVASLHVASPDPQSAPS